MLNKQGPGKIDWTDWSTNPISGCLHGCDYCYLKRLEKRFGFDMTPKFHPDRLNDVSKLKEPAKVFVGSSSDMFGSWVKKKWIEEVNKMFHRYPQHTFQLLTKNPKRYHNSIFPNNCWLGTTIDTQIRADINLPYMKRDIANIQFISFEPLLEAIKVDLSGIDWIIIGANSNKGAEKPEQKWADDLITEARKHDIAVWVKDNFEYKERIKEFPTK